MEHFRQEISKVYITEGKLTVSAASVDTMEEFVTAKDTVIVANRE